MAETNKDRVGNALELLKTGLCALRFARVHQATQGAIR